MNQEFLKHPSLSKSSFWKISSENKELIDKGFPTIVPFSTFPRLAKYIPGLVPSDYALVTANTSVGKSRFTRKVFIKNPIEFARASGIKLKILLNSLEETEAKVEQTFIAEYLFNKYGIKGSFYKLSNYNTTSLTKDQMLKVAEATIWVQENIFKYLEVFSEPNPYVFYKKTVNYLKNVGKFYTITKDINGNVIDKSLYKPKGEKPWNHYEYNEPTIVISIFDTYDAAIGYSTSHGMKYTKYEAIRKYSEQDLRGKLCKICKVIGVAVMQQVEDLFTLIWLCDIIIISYLYGYNNKNNKKIYRCR